jgi:hypothetical protein
LKAFLLCLGVVGCGIGWEWENLLGEGESDCNEEDVNTKRRLREGMGLPSNGGFSPRRDANARYRWVYRS